MMGYVPNDIFCRREWNSSTKIPQLSLFQFFVVYVISVFCLLHLQIAFFLEKVTHLYTFI